MSNDIYEGGSATFNIDGKIVDIKHGDPLPKGLPSDVRKDLVRQSDEVRAAQNGGTLPAPAPAAEPEPEPEAAPAVAGIDAYEDQTAAEIVKVVTAENAAEVKAYEEGRDGGPRATIVTACDKALAA